MDNYKKAVEISENPAVYSDIIDKEETKIRLQRYNAAMLMAEWKDSQPQIIEIFGKRVKIVGDVDGGGCRHCSLSSACRAIRGHFKDSLMCKSAECYVNRHFVEVDEDGNEIE